MKIEFVIDPTHEHHLTYGRELMVGVGCHGIETVMRAPWEPSQADTSVCWGWRLGAPLVDAGKRVLVMERGYLGDRMRWTSLGWDGLNGRAQFVENADGSRFRRHFEHLLHDIDLGGHYALLIGQVPGDASLDGVEIADWYARVAAAVPERFGLPLRFRPHPLAIELSFDEHVDGAETFGGDLADAFDGAAVVITWNSTAGVDAAMRGKPLVAMDKGSMAWPIAAHELRLQTPIDRVPWAEQLAWCQWTMDDMRSGYAWDFVKGAL